MEAPWQRSLASGLYETTACKLYISKGLGTSLLTEPPRVSRRLHSLKSWGLLETRGGSVAAMKVFRIIYIGVNSATKVLE
jgi:hypothetical protein